MGGDASIALAALPDMSTVKLRAAWRRLYRQMPPLLNRDLLVRGLAYRVQELAQGGLSRGTQRRLRALAEPVDDDGDPGGGGPVASPARPVTPSPGARLVREWHGRTHTVTVIVDGFEHEGRRYRSLSHVAQAITGAHWSGPRFFGLTGVRKASDHG